MEEGAPNVVQDKRWGRYGLVSVKSGKTEEACEAAVVSPN